MKVKFNCKVCFGGVDYPIGISEVPNDLRKNAYFLSMIKNGKVEIIHDSQDSQIEKSVDEVEKSEPEKPKKGRKPKQKDE